MSAFAAGAVCLSGWGALSLSGLSAGAAGPCTPFDPTKLAAGVYKSINTTDGCDQAGGTALYPITGFIAASGLTPNAQYTVYDIYQSLPAASAQVYYGAYTLGLVPTVGTATDGAYTVSSGAATYPTLPSAPTGTLPTITTDASGNFSAAYSLTVQNAPAVDMVSSRNDLWLVMDGSDAGHVATISVKPPVLIVPTPTPTATPSPCSETSGTSTSTESCTTSSTTTGTESGTTTTETSTGTTTTESSTTTQSSTTTETSTETSTTTGTVSGTTTTESSSTTSLVTLPSPTPTPAGTVLGTISSSSSTSGGGVGGVITPNTGAGANSTLSTALLGFGLSFLLAGGLLGRRRKS